MSRRTPRTSRSPRTPGPHASERNVTFTGGVIALFCMLFVKAAFAQVAIRAETLHTAAGDPIDDGVVLIGADGTIEAVGAQLAIPGGYELLECAVATPGLVDVRTTAGFTGLYNVPHDQDQFDRSSPMQPQLRAIDGYNARDRLVTYIRSFGVTTIHTGHAPGELITGQTMIAKTRGGTVEDALVREFAGVAATLSPIAQKSGAKSPGTRGKMMEMLRAKLSAAQEHAAKIERWESNDDEDKGDPPARNLELEALGAALAGEVPLIITANRSQDIASALRLADEFGFALWLDMGAEAYLHLDQLRDDAIPVLLHPTMYRAVGDSQNQSYETAKVLADAGVLFAIQSGYEGYVPKVRVVLFEAGAAAGYGGLGFDRALRSVTVDAARILGIDDRVGTLEVGKDGDVALYDGDPFEYTTHCVGTVIQGEVFGGEKAFEINYP